MSDSTANAQQTFPRLAEHNVIATFRDDDAALEVRENLAARGISEGVFILHEAPGEPVDLVNTMAWRLVDDATAEGRVVVGVAAPDDATADVADEVLRAEGVGNIGRFDASGNPRM